MPSDLRLVFMGTPEFAVASLEAILDSGYNVAAVVTAPDKPAGRGMQLTESAVKKFAVAKGLPVLQPEKLKDPAFLEQLRAVGADLQIVVAFRMLPELVWNMPRMGTVNLHGSLLPQYRGAAPINWAVINGEKETGVTTFKLQQDIDTGNILLQKPWPIRDDETAGEVHDEMKILGAGVLVETIKGLEAGTLVERPQVEVLRNQGIPGSRLVVDPSPLKHAPKLSPETGQIDWNKPVEVIYDLIRGLSPSPAAFTRMNGKLLKIYRAEKELLDPGEILPGNHNTDNKTYLRFATPDGYIRITELQLEGKKKMTIGEFLRGYRF
jgi:methionyl-tRNA formyltransferase